MEFKWRIDTKYLQEYLETKFDRSSPEAIRKYFKEFNKMTLDHMFKEEIEDIEKVYKLSREEMSNEANAILPTLVEYMRGFTQAYDAVIAFDQKIEALESKLGRETKKQCCQEE